MAILSFVLFLVGFVLAVLSHQDYKDDKVKKQNAFFAVSSIAYFLAIIFVSMSSYKKGQIDAVTGKQMYHLVTNPDSTKTWEHK